jgi:serine/threonine protein phosphatase 1
MGGPAPKKGEQPTNRDLHAMTTGDFFPPAVVAWLDALPHWYEDQHAIYVHAGLPKAKSGDRFLHPSEVKDPMVLLWMRTHDFFRNYRGKRVVFGHTPTEFLPQELSTYTPEDPTDLFLGENVVGTDTGCGVSGFLSAVELPSMRVFESR